MPIGIYLQPGANAIQVAKAVKAMMERLAQRFPEGLRYDIPFNTTRFVEVSIDEVIMTFIEAIVLVVLVVFLFLQNVAGDDHSGPRRCRCRSSARSPACTRSASRSTC